MNDPPEATNVATDRVRFSLATLMELTTACAVASSLAWLIGPVASFILMLATCGIVLRQGWAVLFAMVALFAVAGAAHSERIDAEVLIGMGASLLFIGLFAWYRVAVRKRFVESPTSGQETKKGHSP